MKAIYYLEQGGKIGEHEVEATKNPDGTYDLGKEGDVIYVTRCPVSDTPKNGHCSLDVAKPSTANKPKP